MLCLPPRFGKGEIVAAVRRNERRIILRHCEERSDEAIQKFSADTEWIASLRSQ
jgi:hypothetical protein